MRCNTNVSKYLRRVSLVQRTRRQARCLLQLLLYLLLAPPNGQVWHKAFFGGSSHRAGAHTRPAWPKILSVPSAFPLLGAPQAPGNKPNPLKGVKALGTAPWDRRKSPAAEKLSARSVPLPARPAEVRPNNWREVQCYYSFSCCSRSTNLVLD